MKKQIVRVLSFILTLTIILTIPAYAMEHGTIAKINGLNTMLSNVNDTTEVLHDENGNEYTVHSIVTSEYSKAMAIDKNNNVIAEFTYVFDKNLIYDINNNVVMIMEKTSNQKTENVLNQFETNSLTWYYMGSFTGYFDITTTSSAILGVLIVAAFPGVGVTVAVGIAVILIESGLSQVYYEMKMYSATDSEYQYIKRVIQFYTVRGGSKLGNPIEGIQKKSLDAA